MKRILLSSLAALALFLPSAGHAADTYKLDPNHTNILWHANHFGFSNPSGRFGIKDGSVTLDEANPANSKVDVVIDIKGLVTGIDKFNEHIKSKDFLDADQFDTASFKSTKVDVTGKDAAKVTGDFTLHGVTKPVVLDVKLNKMGEHPMNQKKTAGFTASTVIKRSDFGISMYVPNVSDEVKIDIEAEASVE